MLGFFLSVLCTTVGCGPSATGGFDDKGYQHTKFDYRVDAARASDPGISNGNLLGSNWKLDNFYHGETNSLVQKSSESYRTEYDFDTNDDGKADFSQEDFLYDLRFKHLKRDAVIWLRTIPISDDEKDKDLRVLLQRYVDEVSGAGFEKVKLGPTTTMIREKRFAARIVDRGPFKLAEQDAYETTFDVANVDDVAINPNARQFRVRIVLARTPFEYTAKPRRGNGLKHTNYAVVMLAGYANLPEDFATDEQDFQQMLDHTVIGGKRGSTALVLETSPSGIAADAKAPAAAPLVPAGSPSAPAAPVSAPLESP